MSQSTDGGITTTAQQHGAKQLSLPLQTVGNFYATEIRRTMIATPASAYAPIRNRLTGYTLLLKWSDDVSQSAWTKNATTGTTTAAISPEGTLTASKLAEDNTTAVHNGTQAMTVASGALRAVVLLKAGERNFARLRFFNATDNSIGATVFNLTTGAIVSGTGQIKALLDGWYACFITGTATVANSSIFIDLSNDGSTFSYAGSTGSGIYVWRATAYLATAYGPAAQTTSTTHAITCGPVDDDDPTAVMVDETELDASMLEFGVGRWGRRFANVPADTISYSSRAINKPTIPNEASATASIVEYNAPAVEVATAVRNNTAFWASDDNVYGPFVVVVSGASYPRVTAGTFTVTYKASTTAALNWNDADATIAAAINGLASVTGDGITVTATNSLNTLNAALLALTLTVGSTTTAFTLNAASLTVTGGTTSKDTWSRLTSTTQQVLSLTAQITASGHGLTNTGSLIVVDSANTAFRIPTAYWSVFDSSRLNVYNETIFLGGGFQTISYMAAFLRTYTPGNVILPARVTERFFVAGLTLGITTEADIPIVTPNISDADVISAVLNDTGFQPVDFSGPAFWDGRAPIYRTVQTDVDFDEL